MPRLPPRKRGVAGGARLGVAAREPRVGLARVEGVGPPRERGAAAAAAAAAGRGVVPLGDAAGVAVRQVATARVRRRRHRRCCCCRCCCCCCCCCWRPPRDRHRAATPAAAAAPATAAAAARARRGGPPVATVLHLEREHEAPQARDPVRHERHDDERLDQVEPYIGDRHGPVEVADERRVSHHLQELREVQQPHQVQRAHVREVPRVGRHARRAQAIDAAAAGGSSAAAVDGKRCDEVEGNRPEHVQHEPPSEVPRRDGAVRRDVARGAHAATRAPALVAERQQEADRDLAHKDGVAEAVQPEEGARQSRLQERHLEGRHGGDVREHQQHHGVPVAQLRGEHHPALAVEAQQLLDRLRRRARAGAGGGGAGADAHLERHDDRHDGRRRRGVAGHRDGQAARGVHRGAHRVRRHLPRRPRRRAADERPRGEATAAALSAHRGRGAELAQDVAFLRHYARRTQGKMPALLLKISGEYTVVLLPLLRSCGRTGTR